MPFVAPLIPVIVAAAGAAITGLSMAGVGQPNQDAIARQQQAQLNAAKLQQAQQDQLAKQKAIQGALANAQEQGGGALNAPSLLQLGTSIAGLPGEVGTPAGQGALSAYLGTPAAGTSPSGESAPAPTRDSGNLSEMIQQLLSRQGGQGGQGGDNLVSSTFGLSGSQG